ncbi:MAG: IS5 family transposase [marine bacterium B5-7]|nr:MAG: IS5 family transposase [marine bacterium B5-7]
MKQSGFSELEYAVKKKKTRKEKFLEEMDEILPWKMLVGLVKRYYPKAGNGRRPMDPEAMLRIYFMQQWYGLSDPGMEDGLYDSMAMRQFSGLGLDEIPDESTILRFRHLLERQNLTEKIFRKTEKYLSERNLILSEGTIVDATIVSAPSSTKNRDKKRDPEMKQTKKGHQWHFGMKVHVGTDEQGRAHSVAVTDAGVHDSQVMDELLHGDETVVYGDKAYAGRERQERLESQGTNWRVNRKARRGKKLNCADRSFNTKSNRTRARVEHIFGVVKHLWGYRKVRYRGLAKNAAQIFTLLSLANYYLARKQLVAT